MMQNQPRKLTRSNPRHSRGGMLVGLFVGLVIGLLCALGVAWYLNKTPLPFVDKATHPEKPETKPATEQGQAPQQLPGKPGDKTIGGAGDKPRFEFYKILPGGQEAAPRSADTKPSAESAAQPDQAADQPPPIVESFYLQAGAFQKSADADNLKAKLALMGLETSVLEGRVPDKGVVFRVRVGPYAKAEEMNKVRNQLAQNGIQATVVKVKDNTGAAGAAPAATTNSH